MNVGELMAKLRNINIRAVLEHGELFDEVLRVQMHAWMNDSCKGRKPSQTTALNAILAVAGKHRDELIGSK